MSTPQSIQEQLQSLEPSAIIELFQLELTQAVNGVDQTYYYHAGTNELTADVVFNGLTYTATAIEVNGFQASTKGVLPRPTMRIANTGNAISALLLLSPGGVKVNFSVPPRASKNVSTVSDSASDRL